MIRNRLKAIREEHGISQAELAEKTGISRTTISKIENNEEAVVTTKTISKIAGVFACSPSDIFML